MKRAVVVGMAVFALMLGTASTAWAKPGDENGCSSGTNRGNCGAVFKDEFHVGPDGSGFDWGKKASEFARGQRTQDGQPGVSEGVHTAKDNGPGTNPESAPGQQD